MNPKERHKLVNNANESKDFASQILSMEQQLKDMDNRMLNNSEMSYQDAVRIKHSYTEIQSKINRLRKQIEYRR